MNRFILRWIINGLALFAAITVVPGLALSSPRIPDWVALAILALIFGFLNALLRPLLMLLSCPLIILTLGLFTLFINTAMLYLTSWVLPGLPPGPASLPCLQLLRGPEYHQGFHVADGVGSTVPCAATAPLARDDPPARRTLYAASGSA